MKLQWRQSVVPKRRRLAPKAFARYEADKERREASVDYATFAPIFAYTMQLTEPVVWAVHTGTWTARLQKRGFVDGKSKWRALAQMVF